MSTVYAPSAQPSELSAQLDETISQANSFILGKDAQIRMAIACLLANGHLLIEDLPGLGKTTLAHVLAHLLGLEFQRVQFTSDMLPGDILGVSIYDHTQAEFRFHPGPVFTQLLLADEVNRATPKAQSALLEAMEERQVSVEGETRPLPEPFFVIATQNPQFQIGTFPLPESQLDRFLMSISIGYPDKQAERALLQSQVETRKRLADAQPTLTIEQLIRLQKLVPNIHVADAILDYVQALLAYSRDSGRYLQGLSPRAGIGMIRAAQAWALLMQRNHVLPEDIQAVLPGICQHRMQSQHDQEADIGKDLLTHVALP